MNNDRNTRTQRPGSPRSGDSGGGLQRIPLPPLPHFRRPTASPDAAASPESGIVPDPTPMAMADPTPVTMPDPVRAAANRELGEPATLALLGPGPLLPGPAHEGLPAPVLEAGPQRSGDIGAAVLNDLVDQIERDIEKDLGRAAPEAMLPPYRRAIPCTFDPATHIRGPWPASPWPPRR